MFRTRKVQIPELRFNSILEKLYKFSHYMDFVYLLMLKRTRHLAQFHQQIILFITDFDLGRFF